jgi:hypothetical protein
MMNPSGVICNGGSVPARAGLVLVLLFLTTLSGACSRARADGALTPERSAAIDKDVRTFLVGLADDVTKRGPAAWRTHFADTPTFYMASEGQMVFADSAAATKGINDLTGIIAKIDLKWGDPVRVEPLTPSLAAVAMPYHEELTDTQGKIVVEDGYFTGLAELGPTGWKIRNAHWSVKPKH